MEAMILKIMQLQIQAAEVEEEIDQADQEETVAQELLLFVTHLPTQFH